MKNVIIHDTVVTVLAAVVVMLISTEVLADLLYLRFPAAIVATVSLYAIIDSLRREPRMRCIPASTDSADAGDTSECAPILRSAS